MTDYFTSDHFKLLSKWKGQKRDETNPEQNRAYEQLKKAYEVTDRWAKALQAKIFPLGYVEIRKRPTSQANTFLPYNWAKIYPSAGAPKGLAYTVGIGWDEGFVVKIDTVSIDGGDPIRRAYEQLRGTYDNTSPVIRMLSMDDGLTKSLQELVDWSAAAISQFGIGYDELAQRVGLDMELTDDEVLQHFDGKPGFKTFRAAWTDFDTKLFCRLARSVHKEGFDWWHEGQGVNVRFGRKNPGFERALAVIGVIHGSRIRTISIGRSLGSLSARSRQPITEELVSRIEPALAAARDYLNQALNFESERPGLWPDQLQEEQPDEAPAVDSVAPLEAQEAITRIYYGPPGTGKTYKLAKLLQDNYEHVSSSVSAEDWRQQFVTDKVASLKWWEVCAAALHDLGGQAKVSQIYEHPLTQAVVKSKGRTKTVHQTLWGTLQLHTIESSETVKIKRRIAPEIFDKSPDSVWRFAGDWREECADVIALAEEYRAGPLKVERVQRYSFVTFHQSFGYEEFVEGLRPVLQDESEAAEIGYEIRPGVFKKLCERARLSPNQRFALVIDEINRGNISKIFGELITLIEVDKREGTANAVSVTLPYSGESFSVPKNVDVIGTMNTADRSLALLDTALRRRFDFEPVLPDSRDEEDAPLHGFRVNVGATTIDIPRMLTAMNDRIEALYDRDHTIGHAYFMGLSQFADGEPRMVKLADIFKNRILPLLEEYFFEDWQKIRLVLADNQKATTQQFVSASEDHEQDLAKLFGTDLDLQSYATKRRFKIQSSTFMNPESYTGIYEVPTI